MADRAVGNIFKFWIGVVEDLNDPDRAGKARVRIIGQHDDRTRIPTEGLPWAHPMQPLTSAGAGGIGTSPTGLVLGSRVVGFWADGDSQFPIMMGTLARAGAPVGNGSTVNGAPAINTNRAGPPPATTGIAANPLSGVSASMHTDLTSDQRDITQGPVTTVVARQNMFSADVPTIASLGRTDSRDVTTQMRAVDPLGKLSSMPCIIPGFLTVKQIIGLLAGIVGGILQIAAQAIRNAILKLAEKIGIFKLMGMLNAAVSTARDIQNLMRALATKVCGVSIISNDLFKEFEYLMAQVIGGLNETLNLITGGLNKFINFATGGLLENAPALTPSQQFAINALIKSAEQKPKTQVQTPTTPRPLPQFIVTEPPIGWIQQYYSYDEDPFPGYIQWKDPNNQLDPVYTLRGDQPNYTSVEQHSQHATQDHFLQNFGMLFAKDAIPGFSQLVNAFQSTSNFASNFGTQQVFGYGSNPIQAATQVVTNIVSLVQAAFTVVIAVRGLVSLATAPASVAYFITKQAFLARQEAAMRAGLMATWIAKTTSSVTSGGSR
jgi:hypothetical protein